MMLSFIEGFLLGLGAAAPLGPINILIMNRALIHYPHAVITGLGAMSADGLYLLLILLGMASFLNNGILQDILGVLGAIFLTYMAYAIFKGRNKPVSSLHLNNEKKQKLLPAYFQGFALTFVNPYTVAFWLSIASYVSSKALSPIMTLVGMFSAISLWVTVMPYFVHRSRHRISTRISYGISLFSTILLAGFGASLLVEVVLK